MQGTFLGFVCMALLAALIGYLFGSINGAILSVRLLKHEDVRNSGSGNAGLTNVLRCYGKGAGILTLIADLGKGAAAIGLAQWLDKTLAWYPIPDGSGNDYRWVCYLTAIFCVLGHVFPLWHGFKGGKGVLVGVSVFLVIDPLLFAILMTIFFVMLKISHYVSLASCTATACVSPATLILEHFWHKANWGMAAVYMCLIAVAAFLVIWSHRENIKRLRAGTERRVGEKKNA